MAKYRINFGVWKKVHNSRKWKNDSFNMEIADNMKYESDTEVRIKEKIKDMYPGYHLSGYAYAGIVKEE